MAGHYLGLMGLVLQFVEIVWLEEHKPVMMETYWIMMVAHQLVLSKFAM
jgi:hypothetical protein